MGMTSIEPYNKLYTLNPIPERDGIEYILNLIEMALIKPYT